VVPGAALTALFAGLLAALVLDYLASAMAHRLQLYAHPNVRSFHEMPTPAIGGLGIVLPVVAYLAWLALGGAREAAALAGGGALLAAVGLWDDIRELGRALRFGCHLAVAVVVAVTVLPDPGSIITLLAVLALVWLINLYNFMDGIDGLAGVQCVVYCVGAHVVGLGIAGWPGDLLWLVAGACLGFLAFNWPPARLFMGDVGSGFLGLLLGGTALVLWQNGLLGLTASAILLAGFWVDASYTLCVRIVTGQPFTQAHRSHLYQHLAAQRGHLWTTVAYLIYAILWLQPLAWLSVAWPSASVLWLLLAVAPVVTAAWRYRAGLPGGPSPEPPG
jgi:Fuc2NAc and GlcNAc transferase